MRYQIELVSDKFTELDCDEVADYLRQLEATHAIQSIDFMVNSNVILGKPIQRKQTVLYGYNVTILIVDNTNWKELPLPVKAECFSELQKPFTNVKGKHSLQIYIDDELIHESVIINQEA